VVRKKRKIKKDERLYLYLLLFFSLTLILALIIYISWLKLELPIAFFPQVSTAGFKEVSIGLDIEEDRGIVKFYSDCYELRMVVDRSQAISIARGQNNLRYFRPLTHDLADDILKNYGIKILMVKITELKNNTYFARLILRQGNKVLSLDSRPSDALALAARTDYLVPVYVKEELFEKYGTKIC